MKEFLTTFYSDELVLLMSVFLMIINVYSILKRVKKSIKKHRIYNIYAKEAKIPKSESILYDLMMRQEYNKAKRRAKIRSKFIYSAISGKKKNSYTDKAHRVYESLVAENIKHEILYLNNKRFLVDKPSPLDKKLSLINKPSHSNKKQKSIVDEIYNKKQKQFDYALLSLGWGISLYYFINIIFHTDIKIEILFILGVLFGLIIILRLLVSYRIKKGYYGMNYEECKELIHYLMENKDKNDIDRGKKIFNEIEEYNGVGQEVTAGVCELQY